jgi:uncharacterized protein (TIGR00730 family)
MKNKEQDSHSRIQNILQSPAYRVADRDVDFLDEDAVRGVRLQLDFLKTELNLQRYGIEQTIVVFGSARIPDPVVAQRRVDTLRAALQDNPADKALDEECRIAERILANSRYYTVAREFAGLVARSGEGPDDTRVTIMTGGGPGIMEAANRGTHDVDARSIGLNIALPHEQRPNSYASKELAFSVHYFAIRKLHFLLRARALVAFPGGFGTLDEIFETLTLVQTGTIEPLPVILVGEEYWRQAFDADFLVREGVISSQDRQLFCYAESAEEIWAEICTWHLKSGKFLLCESEKFDNRAT